MLNVTRKSFHIDVSHFIVFYQRDEQPECDFFAAVEKQCANDKVHPLYVTDFRVVFTKSLEDTLQALLAFTGPFFENLLVRERSRDIALDLPLF